MREPSVLMLGSPKIRLRNKDLGARIWKAIPRNMEEEQAKEIRKGRKSTECVDKQMGLSCAEDPI